LSIAGTTCDAASNEAAGRNLQEFLASFISKKTNLFLDLALPTRI